MIPSEDAQLPGEVTDIGELAWWESHNSVVRQVLAKTFVEKSMVPILSRYAHMLMTKIWIKCDLGRLRGLSDAEDMLVSIMVDSLLESWPGFASNFQQGAPHDVP